MQQQINLLISLETSSKTSLSARRYLELSILFIVLLGFIYLATWWRTSDKRQQIAELTKQQNEKEAAVAKIKADKAADKTEINLKSKLDTLSQRRNAKLQVLTVLTDKNVGNIEGFSIYMGAMAEERVPGISIKAFEISEGGHRIYLEGEALTDDLVPKLLQAAGESKAFEGKTFKQFEIARSKDGKYVDFKLYTEQQAALDVAGSTGDQKK